MRRTVKIWYPQYMAVQDLTPSPRTFEHQAEDTALLEATVPVHDKNVEWSGTASSSPNSQNHLLSRFILALSQSRSRTASIWREIVVGGNPIFKAELIKQPLPTAQLLTHHRSVLP